MDYYEVIYADNKFDIIFELKFNADEMFVYLQGSDEDIHMILSDEVKQRIEDYLTENYEHYFNEMEETQFNTMMYKIKNRI
jgi:hypothetical protein